MVAAKIANMKEGKPRNDTPQICGVSQDDAAQMLSVSSRSVSAAKHAIDKGSPSVVAAVESGELAVSVAAKFVDTITDKKKQEQIAKQGTEAIKDAVKAAKPKKDRPKKTEPTVDSADKKADEPEPVQDEPSEHPLNTLLVLAQRHDKKLAAIIERWPYLSPVHKQRIHSIATQDE
jgi:hypothetical protein